jgi:hypothetical protein
VPEPPAHDSPRHFIEVEGAFFISHLLGDSS